MHRIFFRVFALLMLFLSFAFGAIGKITTVSGNVTIERGAKKEKAVANLALEEKDTIVSGAGATAQIIFNDKTVITVGQNSSFKIEEYLHGGSEPRARFRVNEGAFKTVTGQIAKVAPEKFKVETKTATIGIRGTIFQGTVDRSGAVTVACTRGSIVVMPTVVVPGTPPPPPVVVKEGQFTQASTAGVEPPKTLTPALLKQLDKEVTADKKAQQQEAQSNSGGSGGQGGTTQASSSDRQGGTQSTQGGGDTTTASTATTSNDAQTGGATTTQAPSFASDGGTTQPQQSAAADTPAQGATPTPPPLGAEGLPTAQNITPLAMPTTPTMPSDVVNAVNQTVVASVNSAVTSAVNAEVVEQVTQEVTNPTTPTNPVPTEPTTPTNPLPTEPTTPTTPTVPTTPTEPIPTEPTVPTCEYGGTYPNCNPPPQQYCTNGAVDYPTCTTCPSGYEYSSGSCLQIHIPSPLSYSLLPTSGVYCYHSLDTINVSTVSSLAATRENMYFNMANKSYLHRYFDFDENGTFIFDIKIGKIVNRDGAAYFSGNGYAFSSASEGNVTVIDGFFDQSVANPYYDIYQTYLRGTGVTDILNEVYGAYTLQNEPTTAYNFAASGGLGSTSHNATTYTLYGYNTGLSVAKPSFLNLGVYNAGDTNITRLSPSYSPTTPLFGIDKTTSLITYNIPQLSGTTQATSGAYISEDAFAGKLVAGTIDANNIDSTRSYFFAIPDMDGLGSVADYSSWGFWQAESNQTADIDRTVNFGYWVAGAHTDPAVITAKMTNQTPESARYFGKVLGSVVWHGNEYGAIIVDSNNKVDLTFNFGSGNTMEGSISFATTKDPSNIWRLYIAEGMVSNTGFSAFFDTNSSYVGGSDYYIINSLLAGSYYGPNAESVGGYFDVNASHAYASGVFKAGVTSVTPSSPLIDRASLPSIGLYTARNTLGTPYSLIADFDKNKTMIISAVQDGPQIKAAFVDGNISSDANSKAFVSTDGTPLGDIAQGFGTDAYFKGDNTALSPYYLDVNSTSYAQKYHPFTEISSGNKAPDYSADYNTTGSYNLSGKTVGWQVEKSKLSDLSTATGAVLTEADFSASGVFGGALNSAYPYGNITKTGTTGVLLSEDYMGTVLGGTMTDANISMGTYTVDDTKSFMVSMNDDFNAVVSDDYSSWGYWRAESNTTDVAQFGFWVGGALTLQSEIDNMITANTEATYMGMVMGAVTPTGGGAIDLIKMDANNLVDLNIKFGASQQAITGTIDFYTVSNQAWAISVNGTAANSTFSITPASSAFAATSGAIGGTVNGVSSSITGGFIDGKFYGPNATSIGGAFNAQTATHNANGVFKARR